MIVNYIKYDFHWMDFFVIAVFFVYIFQLTVRFSQKRLSKMEYLLAGRRLTLPVFVLTMFSTWYGGILGVGEFGYIYGLSSWLLQGVPYYFFALLFAVLFAPKAREMSVASTPEQIGKVYGLNVQRLSALFTSILASPAPYVLMIALLLQVMLGLSLGVSLFISVFFSIGYLFRGGFEADRYTDIVFAILMFAGFVMLCLFLFFKFGSLISLSLDIPALHLTWHGGNPPQFMVMWFLIALWTWVEPSFYQRCYAASSVRVAQKGIVISVFCWFLFDCMTMYCALYARALLPDLQNPVMTYPALAELTLPPMMKGFFFVSLLATILSSLNSQFFVSSLSLGRDFFRTFAKKNWSETRWIQVGLVLVGVISICMVLLIPSVIELWYTIGTIMIPGLLLPMITSFYPSSQISPIWMFASMLLGFGTSLTCLLIGFSGGLGSYQAYPFGLEPLFPGLLISVLIWLLGLGRKKLGV